ncbi:hypothetical protein FLACOL_00537 [Flavobacterium columnare]|uniref:Uncharacterized protein n=1 Tax=Flavobacterium columnare TaxID=996 RepID=A0A2N9P892_9FLAO|nr:hypothetical protein FLACOL_00537 [Flavobacterium columnare]
MSKNIQKTIIICLTVFIITITGMSSWYILLHRSVELNISNIIKIIIQVGLLSAIIPYTIFVLIFFLVKKIKYKWLLSFLILTLFVIFIFALYCTTLAMVFYHLDDPKSFFQSFIEIF